MLRNAEPIPEPAPLAEHQARGDLADGIWALVTVDMSKLSNKATRVNITIPARVLAIVDEAAAQQGDTRSGILARAALTYLERDAGSVETTHLARRTRFEERLHRFVREAELRDCFGICVTATPLSPVRVERVHNVAEVEPPLIEFASARVPPLRVPGAHSVLEWKSTLEGTQGRCSGSGCEIEVELTKHGLIEYQLLHAMDKDGRFCPSWFIALLSNAFCGVERFRHFAGTLSVVYNVQVQILPRTILTGLDRIRIAGYDPRAGDYGDGLTDDILLGGYRLGPSEEFRVLATTVEQDFWKAVGNDSEDRLEVDFRAALEQLGVARRRPAAVSRRRRRKPTSFATGSNA